MVNVHMPEVPDVPNSEDGDQQRFNKAVKEILETLIGRIGNNESLIDYMKLLTKVKGGKHSPEGFVVALPGTIYLRTDGTTDTTFYVKETGTGSTGWVAK